MKDIFSSMTRSIDHQSIHARVEEKKTIEPIDESILFFSFFFITFSSFRDKKEKEKNDSLLLIITVGVRLNYHSLFSLLRFIHW